MYDSETNALLYQINYSIASATNTSTTLFYIENTTYHIKCPNVVPLNGYVYKIHTEQSMSVFSSELIINQ
jgi:hypothetical protein